MATQFGREYLFLCILIAVCFISNNLKAQENITYVEYYIDADPGLGNANSIAVNPGINIQNLTAPLDVSNLSFGVHHFYVRARNAVGVWSMVNSFPFIKPGSVDSYTPVANITNLEYYIDKDPGMGNAISVAITPGTDISNQVISLNLDTLLSGVHRFYLRARNASGAWSMVNNFLFFKPIAPDALLSTPNINYLEYYMDVDPGFGNGHSVALAPATTVNNLVIPLDTTGISSGVHRIYFRAKDTYGKWSMTNSFVFYRPYNNSDQYAAPTSINKVEYYFDNDPGIGNGTSLGFQPGTNLTGLLIVSDITNLSPGFHKVFIRAKNETGIWSMVNYKEFEVLDNIPIKVGKFDSSLCAGAALRVPFTVKTARSAGNVFSAVLSDSSGNFSNPVTLGTLNGINNDTISCTIPANTLRGSFYRIKVISSSPADTSVVSSSSLAVKRIPVAYTVLGDTVSCQNSSLYQSSYLENGASYSWQTQGINQISSNLGQASATVTWMQAGSDLISLQVSNNCGSGSIAQLAVRKITPVTPVISASGPLSFCSGGSVVLTSSESRFNVWNNGDTSRNITVTQSGIYRVTAGESACPVQSSAVTITVIPSTIGTFSAFSPVCAGVTPAPLPLISNNGVQGSWVPSTINNQISGVYVFTPTSGACPLSSSVSISVNQPVTPIFAAIPPIGYGAVAPSLPSVSQNGISGTWNPSVLSNTSSGNYVFTPLAGQCAVSTTVSVTVLSLPDVTAQQVGSSAILLSPEKRERVNWVVSNVGTAAAAANWKERIYLQGEDGYNRLFLKEITYYSATPLASGSSVNRFDTVQLPLQLNVGDRGVFVVEIIPGSTLQEAVGAQGNNTGIQSISLSIEKKLIVRLSQEEIEEGSSAGITVTVIRSGNITSSLDVSFNYGQPSRFSGLNFLNIPSGQSGRSFTLYATNNSLSEGTISDTISALASGFPVCKKAINIIDDEKAALTFSNLTDTVSEGGLLAFRISTNLPSSNPIQVYLSSANPSRLVLPTMVTIPAGASYADVSVLQPQDVILENDIQILLTASAGSHFPVSFNVYLKDDDVPGLEMDLQNTVVNESSGYFATSATLRRSSGSSNTGFTANITSSSSNGLLLPSAISFAPGENLKTFNVGVVDNSQAEGDRVVNINAGVYISSCNCTASPGTRGSAQSSLAIIDNDGPSINLTVSNVSMAEGSANAGTLRVARNTSSDTALMVTLSVSDTTEARLPSKIIIPAGASFLELPVVTINDGILDGNQQVTILASAVGFSSGSLWVMVTDQNKPDFMIPNVTVSSNSVQGNQVFSYQASVKNAGFANSVPGLLLYGYLSTDNVIDNSDSLIIQKVYNNSISTGSTVQIIDAVTAPDYPGAFRLLFRVNPLSSQAELIYTNNYSTPIDLTIIPDYSATANVAQPYYTKGSPVSITGTAIRLNGLPAIQKPVEVYIITNGLRRALSAITDSSGNFAAQFIPLSNESGTYTVGASFPGINSSIVTDTFDILGLKINGGEWVRYQITLGDTLRGALSVQNLSNIPLSNLHFSPINLPAGAEIIFDTIPFISANGTASINYRVRGQVVSNGSNYFIADFLGISNEGNIQPLNLLYFCKAATSYLVPSQTSVHATCSPQGSDRVVEIRIRNAGAGSTGNIHISVPSVSWLTLLSPADISNLLPGDTALIVLSFRATQDVPFGYPVNGNFGISSQHGPSLNIPFIFEKVSVNKGAARITVTDQYTYLTAAAPNLSNAHIVIKNYYTGAVYADGYSDSSGIFLASGLPEGNVRIIAEKNQHQSFSGNFAINPGDTLETTVFLNFQAITFSWNVVPTTIQDQYSITLNAVFQTHVPVPVVILDMPDTMPKLYGAETFSFNVILTNYGLITAKEVRLHLPDSDPEYEFITNYVTADLLALQSIQVPVIMRRRNAGNLPSAQAPSIADISSMLNINPPSSGFDNYGMPCINFAFADYWYFCNASNGYWEKSALSIVMDERNCQGSNIGGNCDNCYGSSGGGGCLNCIGSIDPPTGSGTINMPQVAFFVNKGCEECLNRIIAAGAQCGGVYVPPFLGIQDDCPSDNFTFPCLLKKVLNKTLPKPLVDKLECGEKIADAIKACSETSCPTCSSGTNHSGVNMPAVHLSGQLASVYSQFAKDLDLGRAFSANVSFAQHEMFDSLPTYDSWKVFYDSIEYYTDTFGYIPSAVQVSILNQMSGFDMPQNKIQQFFGRWNLSIQALQDSVFSPNAMYPGIINWNTTFNALDSISFVDSIAKSRGSQNILTFIDSTVRVVLNRAQQSNNAVCASVKIQLSQRLTMTREAFKGTLDIFNGHPSDGMDSISVEMLITDENGVPSNNLFEVQNGTLSNIGNISGTGFIYSQQHGTVEFLFVPKVTAAPIIPKVYKFGGSIRYWDPYVRDIVIVQLSPVALTVNPSPKLKMHYFLERNILGDDALTPSVIEPSIPAQLAVMVDNYGYGSAINLTISSAQPRIVDNEKGLAINFSLIGSSLQGQAMNLGLNDINFGTIPALGTKIGQWFMTSSLLGNFTDYTAEVVHDNSFGDPELSLIDSVKLHELAKSIREYGLNDDGMNDFLVNDFFDANDIPDIIYFSQGKRTAEVRQALSGSFSAPVMPPSFTNTLTIAPSAIGWNYVKLQDPGNGRYDIVSVTRSDGQVIPLDNAWLTFVTLPVNQTPVYENKFQFVDTFASIGTVSYTVVWSPKNFNVPKVLRIEGVPGRVSSTQIQSVTVVFNKAINASSFTRDDLSLSFQGGANLIDSAVSITQLDSARFNVDISNKTIGNGYYRFIVQALNVSDIYGINGLVGKDTGWTQFLDVPTVESYRGLPAGNTAASISTMSVKFNMPIDPLTCTSAKFNIKKDGVSLAGSVAIDSASLDKQTFYLSGLQNILGAVGDYYLVVDLPSIQSVNHIYGVAKDSVKITIDNEGPIVQSLIKSFSGGLDNQHVTNIKIQFNEGIIGLNETSLRLTRNGVPLILSNSQISNIDAHTWIISNFGVQTYPDGNYEFTILAGSFTDQYGNIGHDSAKISWSVVRNSDIAITDLFISPDLGYSAIDGITSIRNMQVSFRLSASASQLLIYQQDLSGSVVLKSLSNLDSGYHSASISLVSGGATSIRMVATGIPGGSASITIALFIDEFDLRANWQSVSGQSFVRQFDTVAILYSSRILTNTDLSGTISLTRNGFPLSAQGIQVSLLNDSLYLVSGFRRLTNGLPGNYELKADLSNVRKYLSGKEGSGSVSLTWNLLSQNNPPVANAGSDFTITSAGTYVLDASGSSDPNNDSLTYSWVAPSGVVLSSNSVVSPSFNISQSDNGNIYSFLLIVNDGLAISTDQINITVDIPADSTSFSGLDAAYCISDAPVALVGIPAGGTFSGPGITGNQFNPSVVGAGTHVITYTRGQYSKSMNTTVNTQISPVFNQVSASCTGASLATLPSTSNNSISGSWSPAINNAVTTTYTFTPNSGQCASSASMTISIVPCAVTLSVKAFIQGYQIDDSTMASVLLNSGVSGAQSNQSDSVSIEIRDPMTGDLVAGPYPAVLSTSGLATLSIAPVSGYKYLVIKHRNAIETWSAQPLLMSELVYYDFTTAASKAYGNNQAQGIGNTYAFWSGDINQDGMIEAADYSTMENDVISILFGYYPSDLTGDGVVEAADYSLMENNVLRIIFALKPF